MLGIQQSFSWTTFWVRRRAKSKRLAGTDQCVGISLRRSRQISSALFYLKADRFGSRIEIVHDLSRKREMNENVYLFRSGLLRVPRRRETPAVIGQKFLERSTP